MKVIIAAAGTGGHINPGIAIANKIEKMNPKSEILFIGTSRGIENDLVPRAGYKLERIEAYGFSLKLSIDNIRKMFATWKSIKVAEKIILKFKPDVVIGTGGYICGPVLIAAHRNGIPTALHESNSYPGLAVKMLKNKTNIIMVGLKEAKENLPGLTNVVVTGTPTKINKLNLTTIEKDEIKLRNQLNKKNVVLVFGGSQGAKQINNAMLDIIREQKERPYQIVWAVGQKNYDEIMNIIKAENLKLYDIQILAYIYNMEELMNIADLVVCRSGAITITEVTKLGKAAIFIPLPNVSQNHQEKNARVLEKIGAAKIILNDELTGTKLQKIIEPIITDRDTLKYMETQAHSINIENVEEKIYNEILKITK